MNQDRAQTGREVLDNCILHEWILGETTASSPLYFPPTFDNRELSVRVCVEWGGGVLRVAAAAVSDGAAKLHQRLQLMQRDKNRSHARTHKHGGEKNHSCSQLPRGAPLAPSSQIAGPRGQGDARLGRGHKVKGVL